MAFSARLVVEDMALAAKEVHWSIVQVTDQLNQPHGGILVGKIHLVLDCLMDPLLDAWMADTHKHLSGEVVISGLDGISRRRTLRFTEAFCVNEGLFFDGTANSSSGALSILISARTLVVDNELELTNKW